MAEFKLLEEELVKLDGEIKELSIEYRASKAGEKGQLMDRILDNINEARQLVNEF